jgi:precorrin-6B methylase 2
MTAAPASPTSPGTLSSLLVRRLPQPLLTWVVNARTLLRHPTALTTIGVVFRRNLAADAGAPWWNDRAIHYLDQNLRPGDRVFEWGSGASTVWLVGRGAKVISVEHDPDWVSKVRERCPEADVRAFPEKASDYVAAIDEFEDGSFDVVIVDGTYRAECLHRGASKVKPGGLLVLDDTDMRQLARLKKLSLPGWKTVSFTGFKASRDVRETTFFRRPL